MIYTEMMMMVEKSGEEEARRRRRLTLMSDLKDLMDNDDDYKDVTITCSDSSSNGHVKIPSLILGAISPLLSEIEKIDPTTSSRGLILPHLSTDEIQLFFKHLFVIHESEEDEELHQSQIDSIEKVKETLCCSHSQQDENKQEEGEYSTQQHQGEEFKSYESPISSSSSTQNLKKSRDLPNFPFPHFKKKTGRRKGEKVKQVSEPYFKVIQTPRTETVYGLRKVRKKKIFADEIQSEDEENDAENIPPVETEIHISDEDLSDYNPDVDDSDDDEDDINEDDDLDEEDDQNLDVETDGEQDEENEEIINYIDESEVETTEEVMTMLTVNVRDDGAVEIIDQVDDSIDESLTVTGIGKVINIMTDDEPEITYRKIYGDDNSGGDPRSLLKTPVTKKQLYLICSLCHETLSTKADLKHHCAVNHPGSKFFRIPESNPHKNCFQCKILMKSYEQMMIDNPELLSKNVCFPCPHCRRRHMGHFQGFLNHLSNDHRYLIAKDLESNDKSYFYALRREDEKVLICEFCDKDVANTKLMNHHLMICRDNTSGNSAGLFCQICGKMFEQRNSLKQHLNRHDKNKMKRPRNYFCKLCPVTCTSERNLEKHIQKVHNEDDPDLNFVLHQGCDRCLILYNSYIANQKMKSTDSIAFRDIVFKCPHCSMLLYANFKHAPRYIYNHVNKFHMDPEINDMTIPDNLTDNGQSLFRIRSKQENDIFTCEFCQTQSINRNEHNAHLSMCPSSTVTCRPGYMCDTCGFITGTFRHLRDHINTQCSTYKNEKSPKRQRKNTNYVTCTRCGKLRKEGPSMKAHLKKCGIDSSNSKICCTECDMDFKHIEDMQAHSLIHYGQVTCPIHNILFKNENEVYHHVNRATPDDKHPILKCCMCEKTFRHMCIFMSHLRRHLRISPYRCNICYKHLQSYASLQLHYKRTHAEDQTGTPFKSFVCEYCTKVFGTKGHLKEHIAGVHERYNNVNCPVCHKSFNTQKRMKKHLFNTHKDMADQFRSHSKVEAYAGLSLKI